MPATSAEPVILTITTGVVSGGANRQSYNYVGTFPGVMEQSGTRFAGGAPVKELVSNRTGVTAPWARIPMKFKV